MTKTAASRDFPCEACSVRGCSICAALNDNDLRRFNDIATAVALAAGQTVFHEGENDTYLFNVVDGTIRLSKALPDGRRQVTGFLFPGDFLGLSAGGSYAYSAETITQASFCRFERRKLMDMATLFPKLEQKLLSLAFDELAQAQEHLVVLGQKSATEKVATVLLRLSDRIGALNDGILTVDLPMTREDIADYAGLTLETVSRQMSRLRKLGLIADPTKRQVQIIDPPALRDLTGDL